MGILNKLFKSDIKKTEKQPISNVSWVPLTTLAQIEDVKKNSKEAAVVIFKHSTRCGISRMVIKQFEKSFTEDMKDVKVYYLDLLNYRELSNEVGYAFQVLHQSPQLLVIKNGVAVAYASHYDILQVDLKSF